MLLGEPLYPSHFEEQVRSPSFSGRITNIQEDEFEPIEALLNSAASFAVAPLSGFHVGAVAFGHSGHAYIGANMEFTGVPLAASLHAEQSAIVNAWMHGEPSIQSLFISQSPCGHCRQFLWELSHAADLKIVVKGVAKTLGELLPNPFGSTRPKERSLLDSTPIPLRNARSGSDDLQQRAINAAIHSYTPYTHSPEGFVIETINGQYFAGRAAESVAFNPTVTAVVAALNQMNLSAHRGYSISRCAHAKLATALEHTLSFSQSLMKSLCAAPVESVLMETER